MNLDDLGKLVTVVLVGGAGWFVAQRMRIPVAARTWVLLAVAAVAGSFVKFRLVSVFGFTVYGNLAIPSCCLGVLLCLIVRGRASQRVRGGTA